jgi:DNA-binding transcriptional MerR regulator
MEVINPERLYSIGDAARRIPSNVTGHEHITPKTLRNWCADGLVAAVRRPGKKRHKLFIRGSELQRILQTEPVGAAME